MAVVRAPVPEPTPKPIRLVLPARPETIAQVRHTAEKVAEDVRLPRRTIDDIRLAVTEACTNVVRHAYEPGGHAEPELEVAIEPAPGALRVVVEDRGRGLGTSTDVAGPGLGLSLIAALASRLEVEPGRGRGTRLSMSFAAGPSGQA